jgi:hypothetical protein
MARFYTNQNIPLQVVTSLDAGMANSAVPDAEVRACVAAKLN